MLNPRLVPAAAALLSLSLTTFAHSAEPVVATGEHLWAVGQRLMKYSPDFDLLARSRVATISSPLSAAQRKALGQQFLAKMKQTYEAGTTDKPFTITVSLSMRNYDTAGKRMYLYQLDRSPSYEIGLALKPIPNVQVALFDEQVRVIPTNASDFAYIPMSEADAKSIVDQNLTAVVEMTIQPIAARSTIEIEQQRQSPYVDVFGHIIAIKIHTQNSDPKKNRLIHEGAAAPVPSDRIGRIAGTGKGAFAAPSDDQTLGLLWQKIVFNQLPDCKANAAWDTRVKTADEFDRPAVTKYVLDEFARRYEAIDVAQPFTVQTTLALGEYDAEKQAFNVLKFPEAFTFESNVPFFQQRRSDNLVVPGPLNYNVVVSNIAEVSSLKMSPDEARTLIDTMQSAASARHVHLSMIIQPERAIGDDPNVKYLQTRTIVGKVTRIQLNSAGAQTTGEPLLVREFAGPAGAPQADVKKLDIGLDPATADVKGVKLGASVDDTVTALKASFPNVVYSDQKPEVIQFMNEEKMEQGGVGINQDGRAFVLTYTRVLKHDQVEDAVDSLVAKYGKPVSDSGRQGNPVNFTVDRYLGWTHPVLKPERAGVTAKIIEKGTEGAVLTITILLPGEHRAFKGKNPAFVAPPTPKKPKLDF